MWLGLGLLRLIILLPYPWLMGLGGVLGRFLYKRLRTRRHVVLTNLKLCFPDLDEQAQESLAKQNFEEMGRVIFDTALAWWGSERRLRRLQVMEGVEQYEAARATGKGVLLFGGHYTTLEISGRLAGFHIGSFYPVYKEAENPLFDGIMRRARGRHYAGMVGRFDMRGIVRLLKAGETVWYAPDQDLGERHSVFAPFFGVSTSTLKITANLARLTGAAVLPTVSVRLPGAQGYRVRILPPLENFPSGDEVADAARLNRILEAEIRKHPAQYLWAHRRFKSRPEGEAPIYEH